MKRLFCGCVAMIAVTTPSFAQAPVNWSGFYLGAHIGNGWAQDDFNPNVFPQQFRPSGVLGGAQFGFNRMLGNSRWVWGVEVDFSFAGVQQGTATPENNGASIRSFGTDRVRLGYSVGSSLLYVTGGLAWADAEFSNGFRHGRNVQVGWTAGVGVEHALNETWSFKIEYLFADLGTSVHVATPSLTAARYNTLSMDMVRVGVNYHPASFRRQPWTAASPMNSWAGPYIGISAIYSDGSFYYDDIFSGRPQAGGFDGGFFGFQSGYNWLLSVNSLFGIESDFGFGKANGQNVMTIGVNLFDVKASIDRMGSTRLRLGFFQDRLLVYGTAGVAYAHFLYDFRQQGQVIPNASHDTFVFGWTGGLGVEYLLAREWSAKIEYRHFDFSNDLQSNGFTSTSELSGKINSVLVGLNYRGALFERLLARQ